MRGLLGGRGERVTRGVLLLGLLRNVLRLLGCVTVRVGYSGCVTVTGVCYC